MQRDITFISEFVSIGSTRNSKARVDFSTVSTCLTMRSFFFNYLFWLHWVFVAVQGLCVVAVRGGYSLVAMCGLLIVVVSLVVEYRL